VAILTLSPAQQALVERPLDAQIFLEGPAGCGKTTASVERLLHLMAQGVPGSSILVLVPQRTLAAPYQAALDTPGVVAGGPVTVLTVGGLAQRMVDLFWPLVAAAAGFAHPEEPPVFLTLETAQYYMAHLVAPRLEQGLFDSVTIDRNRLYSQILDNLNKAAVVGFPHTEIETRLQAVRSEDPGQARVYADAQACATLFRQYCLEHNLLDFSLQVETFFQYLWPDPVCRGHLQNIYRHLIADNIEEDTPVAHDLLRDWLPHLDSALLVYDQEAGYRRFLGADPLSAYSLKELCSERASLTESFVLSEAVQALGARLAGALRPAALPLFAPQPDGDDPDARAKVRSALGFAPQRFYPQMLDWVAQTIAGLVHDDGLPPSEIVVLAPFLSDALRYSLMDRLQNLGVPSRSHRPSRSLREEPATQCLLTLAVLAHPQWLEGQGRLLHPSKFDVAYALVQAIDGLDLVRAQLLAEIVYRVREGAATLSSFDQIKPDVQERITYRYGERYEALRQWLEAYRQEGPLDLDHFLSRLFGEVLSQPGFGFHANFDAGAVAANLIESVQKFRWVAGPALAEEGRPLGQEYLAMVQDGVIASQYVRGWRAPLEEAVLLAPAYTFLMSNRPVDVQFWLDVGSRGWAERLYQPVTHPYVLSRQWQPGRPWTDVDEIDTSQEALYRLASGLVRRCRKRVYLGLSQLDEQGYEERGSLLRAFQKVLQQTHAGPG
jgi:hypothetical protein